jgi:hypothetical protein
MQNFRNFMQNDAKKPRYNKRNVRFGNWDESCIIVLAGKFVSKHNKKTTNMLFNCEFETRIVLSHQINNVQILKHL